MRNPTPPAKKWSGPRPLRSRMLFLTPPACGSRNTLSHRIAFWPHAGGVKKSIRDRSGRGPDHFFAGGVGFLIQLLDDNRGHFGAFLKPQDGITVPVETGDVRLRERHFLH